MRSKTAAIVLIILLIFCACTVQSEFDVYDFCVRFNTLSGEKILATSDFLSDSDGSLYCFFSVGESKVLITLDESESSSLKNVYFTLEKNQFNNDDLEEIINTAYLVFGAFNYGETEKAKKLLSSVGFDGSFSPFCDLYECEKDEKYKIVLYSNEYYFTLSQEKIDSD